MISNTTSEKQLIYSVKFIFECLNFNSKIYSNDFEYPCNNRKYLNFVTGITSAAVPSLATPNNQANGGNGVAKNILEYVVAHISEFKKLNQETLFQGLDHDDDLDGGSSMRGSSGQVRRPSDAMMIEGMAVSAAPRPR